MWRDEKLNSGPSTGATLPQAVLEVFPGRGRALKAADKSAFKGIWLVSRSASNYCALKTHIYSPPSLPSSFNLL